MTPEYRALMEMNAIRENQFEAERLSGLGNQVTYVLDDIIVMIDDQSGDSNIKAIKDALESARNPGLVGFVVDAFSGGDAGAGQESWPVVTLFFESEGQAQSFKEWYYDDEEVDHDPIPFRTYLDRLAKVTKARASKFVELNGPARMRRESVEKEFSFDDYYIDDPELTDKDDEEGPEANWPQVGTIETNDGEWLIYHGKDVDGNSVTYATLSGSYGGGETFFFKGHLDPEWMAKDDGWHDPDFEEDDGW